MAYMRQRGFGGLGQTCAQSDPNAGTISSINCPGWCIPIAFTSLLGLAPQSCWPCSNVCPPGTCWDTTNLVCTGAPASTNSVVPVASNPTAPPPTPVDCSQVWNQITSAQCGASPWALLAAGVVIISVIGATLANKA